MTKIGAHADHDARYYTFQREQSRATRDLEWGHRGPIIKTWRGDIAAAVAVILLSLLAFPAAEILSEIVAR
jgi:hypothetical protein